MVKYFMLGVSGIMVAALILALFFYQNTDQIMNPQMGQPNSQQGSKTPDQTEPDALLPVNTDPISYSLQNNELNISYNSGNDWVKVPIEKDLLFEGEYRGNKQELIDGSYVLTENRAAFLYSEGSDWETKRILLKYSLDQGATWQEGIVSESFPSMRFRKVDFLNEQFGYVIISGGRTMSSEYSIPFLTYDGGKSWEATAETGKTRLIADGGFVDESTGFLSYGTINPAEPDFYVTQDGGTTWKQSTFQIPEKFKQIFVQAETPTKEGEHLAVLVNQGPNGDYRGGRVKGKFISDDNGLTWEFSEEVQPIEGE